MANPIKIRATLKGDTAILRVLMNHPMETGARKDSAGVLLPLHFIREFSVKVNGRLAIEGQTSQAVSRDPVFTFRLKNVRAGDQVEVAWLDNKGQNERSAATLA